MSLILPEDKPATNFTEFAMAFAKRNKGFPSVNQIVKGLMEHLIQNGHGPQGQAPARYSPDQVVLAFKQLMEKFGIKTSDSRISRKHFQDPNSPLVHFIIYLYTIEPPLYSAVNRAQIQMDLSLVDQLGPFSFVLNAILSSSEALCQSKIEEDDWLTVYRGALLTDE